MSAYEAAISLPDSVWRGLFGEYRDLVTPTTEAPEAYHFGIFAAVLGITLARRIWVNYALPTYPNFYVCEVGTTALTRKGTAGRRGRDLLDALHYSSTSSPQPPSPLTIIPGIGSAEGLMDCLDGDRKVLLVAEDEFRSLLAKARQEALSNLIPKLTSLYDCPPIETLKTRKNTVIAKEPFVSIITGTTKAWLQRSLMEADIYGGFANRFIYLIGDPKQPMAFPPKVDKDKRDELLDKINKIRLWAEGVDNSPSKGEITLSEPAKIIFDPYYQENYARCQDETLSSIIIRRAPLHAMKFALLYAAIDQSTQIEEEHMEPAIEAAKHLEVCAQSIFSDFGDTHRAKMEKKVLDLLKERGGKLSQKEIYYILKISAAESNLVISGLERARLVAVFDPTPHSGAGRPKSRIVELL